MSTTYAPERPIMTRDELATHHVRDYGRNYAESDDGYSDMAAEEKRGWRAQASWGQDGWNLGDWPYLVLYVREASGRFEPHDEAGRWELLSICEGDRSLYRFVTQRDRFAALDYLFLWYSAGEEWSPITRENRAALDAGTLRIEDRFRGPYRVAS